MSKKEEPEKLKVTNSKNQKIFENKLGSILVKKEMDGNDKYLLKFDIQVRHKDACKTSCSGLVFYNKLIRDFFYNSVTESQCLKMLKIFKKRTFKNEINANPTFIKYDPDEGFSIDYYKCIYQDSKGC